MAPSCCCEEEKKVEPPNPRPDPHDLPGGLGAVELNLDVLITHILHEVHPDPPNYIMPKPNTPEEREIIE